MVDLGSQGRPTTVSSATFCAMPTASSYLDLGTSIRLNAMQVCPLFPMSWATNSGMSFCMSASSSMRAALLPPSSVRTSFSVAAPASVMRLPAREEPVKLIKSTSGWHDMVSPTPMPVPTTMLKTPLGRPAS